MSTITSRPNAAHSNHIKKDSSQIVINIITYITVTIFCIICISTYSYELLFRSPDQMIGAYIVTILLALIGTGVGLFIIAMTGYALQRRDFPLRNGIMFYIYFTSLFSAGLVPFYLLIVQTLNLRDTYWAILLPLLMSPWLIVLMKNFVKAIPHEITESVLRADPAEPEAGAGNHRSFPGAELLERVVLFLPVPDLQGGIPSPAVSPV